MERSANDITNMQCALILAKNDQQTAYNLRFRGGPCNVCGGPCLCLGSQLLAARLVTGLKPVGSFPFNSEADAKDCSEALKAKEPGLDIVAGGCGSCSQARTLIILFPDVALRARWRLRMILLMKG